MPPILSSPVIADVSDRSFALIWTSDQAGQPSVEVYADGAGSIPVNNVSVSHYPVLTGDPALTGQARVDSMAAIVQAAQAAGIVKLSVSGLTPDTPYYVKFGFENTALESTLCPDAGVALCPDSATALLSLRTAREPSRISDAPGADALYVNNMLLLLMPQLQQGELVLVGVEYSQYPLSVFAGDGVSLPYALVDLNNLYAQQGAASMKVTGSVLSSMGNLGESMVVRHYLGSAGSTTELQSLDVATGNGAVIDAELASYGDCNGDTLVNGYDALLMTHALAGTFAQNEYASVAFHPLLCNLFADEGALNVSPQVIIDSADNARLKNLLIGNLRAEDLPEFP